MQLRELFSRTGQFQVKRLFSTEKCFARPVTAVANLFAERRSFIGFAECAYFCSSFRFYVLVSSRVFSCKKDRRSQKLTIGQSKPVKSFSFQAAPSTADLHIDRNTKRKKGKSVSNESDQFSIFYNRAGAVPVSRQIIHKTE